MSPGKRLTGERMLLASEHPSIGLALVRRGVLEVAQSLAELTKLLPSVVRGQSLNGASAAWKVDAGPLRRAACESPPTQRQSDKTLISTKWLYKVKPSTRAHWGSTDENDMKKRSRRQRQSDNAREQRRHCGSTESDTE